MNVHMHTQLQLVRIKYIQKQCHYGGGAGPLPGVSIPGPGVDRFDSCSFCMNFITFVSIGVIVDGMLPDNDESGAAPLHIAWLCWFW